MTDTTITAMVVAICTALPPTLAALAALYQSRVNASKTEAQSKTIQSVSVKQDEIHKLVNKPMGMALEALAVAKETIARTSRDPEDVIEAVGARKASNEHNINQAVIDQDKQRAAEVKAKIISDFLDGGSKPSEALPSIIE